MSVEEKKLLQVTALTWGVKESFRRYVEGSGAIQLFGAATRAADGAFVFAATGDSDLRIDAEGALRGRAAFSGEVLFKAHGGALNIRLTDPVIEIGEKATLFVMAESGGHMRRAEFAQLVMNAATIGREEIIVPAKLDWDGSDVLDNHYPATTPIDPVHLMLDVK